MNINRRELLRYLGWKGQDIDTGTQKVIDEVCSSCTLTARPAHTAKAFDYDGETLVGTDFTPQGNDIRRHLEGCAKVIVLAVTIGVETDRLIDRLFASSAQKAVIADSAASCLVESLADDVCDELQRKYGPLTARFSCGYGDFPISAQRGICALLSTDTRIGLCVDAGGSLVPRKSITAIVGIKGGGKPFPFSQTDKCALCGNKDCTARDTESK